jgi:hypothetical protein
LRNDLKGGQGHDLGLPQQVFFGQALIHALKPPATLKRAAKIPDF